MNGYFFLWEIKHFGAVFLGRTVWNNFTHRQNKIILNLIVILSILVPKHTSNSHLFSLSFQFIIICSYIMEGTSSKI